MNVARVVESGLKGRLEEMCPSHYNLIRLDWGYSNCLSS